MFRFFLPPLDCFLIWQVLNNPAVKRKFSSGREDLYIRKIEICLLPRRYINNFAPVSMNSSSNTRLENLKKYLSDDPKDSFLRYALAIELINQNEQEEAGRLLHELIEDDPDYLATYYQYGKLLEQIDNYQEAIEIYKVGLKIAEKQNNARTFKELKQAIESLNDNKDEIE